MGTLDGLVAVVTGGGRGLGRAHALLLAREGAKVVVNDAGTANDGGGADGGPAKAVVAEIEAAGGTAVADTSDVSDWSAAGGLVAAAVDAFGGLDIVVNNAGILRDAFLANLTEEQWDAVLSVNLKGHAGVLHHAAAYWKALHKAGHRVRASVINTTSASGVTKTLPGQANYAAAKAGIVALTLVAAAELERYGVRANAIAPAARTRLTLATPAIADTVAGPEDGSLDPFAPENLAPLVAYLASPSCELTGQVFTLRGDRISPLGGWRPERTFETAEPWSADTLAALLPGR
ncbi:SDR family oxidoreductase [Actinomadura rugatobispora]|uniref:SDR family oxidoreductase n=1 Tax=Actinomadura rugatobispora TaxID=1994 RepID=A0ABW0ZXM9_9ACTN